ncbi:MAG: proteasome accessory factor PafA2 family protein [Deltaproteobacteria bacterium]|nr:proteasome accessory factor PafA2 family protein [Deltaproteobacteria bacterium]
MRERVYGLETEYLPVFFPEAGSPAPRLRDVFEAVALALKDRFPTLPVRYRLQHGVFFGNGGKLAYEARDDHPLDGLIESATPECRSAREAMLYSRAFDRMLSEAVPAAEALLRERGFAGRLLIAKNSADAEGRTYGCNENYLCDDPVGGLRGAVGRVALALCWALALGPARVLFYLPLVIMALVLGGAVLAGLLGALVVRRGRAWLAFVDRVLTSPRFEETASRGYGRFGRAVLWAPVMLYAHVCRAFLFRRVAPGLTPFLCTRLVFAGDGHLEPDGEVRLSTKAAAIGAVARIYFDDERKPLIDLKHAFVAPRSVLAGRRRRLHVMGSDSTMAETAEHLKLGTTGLVLEWLEAGGDAADLELRDPIAALRIVAADPRLEARLELRNGTRRTALEIQEEYLRRVRAHFKAEGMVGLDAWQVLGDWERVLGLLRHDREALVGEVDWITKQLLCDAAVRRGAAGGAADGGAAAPPVPLVLRKLDLKYHVLDSAAGYYYGLRAAGRARRLVTDAEVERAMFEPPAGTRARARGLAVQEAAALGLSGRVSWDWVKLAGRKKLVLRDPLADGSDLGAKRPATGGVRGDPAASG